MGRSSRHSTDAPPEFTAESVGYLVLGVAVIAVVIWILAMFIGLMIVTTKVMVEAAF
ncbi:hypothetical protein LCGC14_3105160 [marine sediment metagenome]|uniref:Uncharacterized protein n=1 Tax=marine sediment metagenome TaxID=412755 RepID=A0A0F8YE56_9ZZZZ